MLVGLKRRPHDLAVHQEKVFKVDSHMGVVISGMTADARIITKLMQTECRNYEFTFGSKQPSERLIAMVSKKAQTKTCHPSKRPFGVGLLVGAVDATGSHLFETCPSGNYYEYQAMAIGDKNQSAKTYLERNFESFGPMGEQDLITQGLKAMKASAAETELTEHNVSVGVVSQGNDFRNLTTDEIRTLLDQIGGDQPMQVDQ